MAKYRVTETTIAVYEFDASSEDAACESLHDRRRDVEERSTDVEAVRLCPRCGDELTDKTMRPYHFRGHTFEEPSYCDTCDREIEEE